MKRRLIVPFTTHLFSTQRIAIFLTALLLSPLSRADVKLPGIFGDHMVLQRDMKLPVWGWAAGGEKVTVQVDKQPAVSATADAQGRWRVQLPPLPAGGPHTLTVTGKNTVIVKDVLVGEVWLCSGQSNMEWVVGSSDNAPQEIAAANFPQIRQIKIPKLVAAVPADNVSAPWQVCAPGTVAGFTAAGYFMARHLHKELGVPIGLINSSWGGTLIEPWTPVSGFADVPALKDIHQRVVQTLPNNAQYQERLKRHLAEVEKWSAAAKEALAKGAAAPVSPAFPEEIKPLASHQSPTTLFNAMINPFVGFALRGAIWYQGESNHAEGMRYVDKMQALIDGWRKLWGQSDFPFYYVMIAPYKYGSENPQVLPRFWEAQNTALKIRNTGMVVPTDIGNVNDIHPRNKQEVGRRLALLALKNDYGKKDLVATGPTFKSLSVEGSKLRVTFDNTAGGLKSRDQKPLTWFELIGEDTEFVKATAVIDGDSVLLSAPEVKKPAAMRFGWHKEAEPNLANGAGLPAVPFQAGEVPKHDYLALKVPEADGYKLVYDLDLAKLSGTFKYDVDQSAALSGAFDRIAYFLELHDQNGGVQYCYVSMDTFTKELKKIGIPTAESGARFQTNVKGVNVISNVKGVPTGSAPDGCNIEFWPGNYGPQNSANVPGASATVFDFGDQPTDPVDGYGSMQVHNHRTGQTLFAINNWKAGPRADLGIGSSTGQTRDWTFTGNASSYSAKRLRVLVRMK